ncbi:MAG TPA: ATP-grasp domain-containing protein, partial [Spirochaetota bacterium]|nr:ATP-grasp domain-containing protein [Spirochaetota bacterium]
IDLAEDRIRFSEIMKRLGIPQPESGMASTIDEAVAVAEKIGYPVIVRPSYVLGGRAMEIIHGRDTLKRYVQAAVDVSPERPIYIDRFLDNAIEAEADAICDGVDAFVPAVMEHIELAGVHSGDSACVIPSVNIPEKHIKTIEEYTRRIAIELGVRGLMNIQYAIEGDTVYILEANPRASRTVPLVSKVCNISMARIATQIMLGKTLKELGLKKKEVRHYGVKESVFPFNMFPEVDPLLGPEMRSTGEVLGLADSFGLAFAKSQEAAQMLLPLEGTALITVNVSDRPAALEVARELKRLGFGIMATKGGHAYLAEHGVPSEEVLKIHEGRPNIIDKIKNREIHLVINTPDDEQSGHDDSYIRKSAIKHKITYITTMSAAIAAMKGIEARKKGIWQIKSLQEYHRG